MQITKGYIERRIGFLCQEMGWNNGPVWVTTDDGRRTSQVGAVFIQKGPCGGFSLVRITNENGGEENMTGHGRLTMNELDAWIGGLLFSKEIR